MAGEENQVKWRGVQPVSGIRGIWPSIDALRISKGAFRVGAGTTIVYTVPASKLLFISCASLTSRLTAVVACYTWAITRDVLDATDVHLLSAYFSIVDSKTVTLHYKPAIEVPAGYDVVIYVSNANLSTRVGIFGWLEDD